MKVILLEDIIGLGRLGDIVVVKPGYARNFLMPYSKAKRATEDNLKEFEANKIKFQQLQNEKLSQAQNRYEQINNKEFIIMAKAGPDGKLFGSVSALDICAAIKVAGVEVEKSEVILPHGALKSVGEFDIVLNLHHDIKATIKIKVTAEQEVQ